MLSVCFPGRWISQRLFKGRGGGGVRNLFSALLEILYSSAPSPDSHCAISPLCSGPSTSSSLTQKLDKKTTVGRRQASETETHGGSCWATQLIRGNKSVPSLFVWRSEQQPSRARGGLFVHGVIWPSGPFSIPWTSWPWPLAASLAPSQPPNLWSCNEHLSPFPNWLCNSPHTLPQRRGEGEVLPADSLFFVGQNSRASRRNPELVHWRVWVISVRSVFKSVFSLCVIGEIKTGCCF